MVLPMRKKRKLVSANLKARILLEAESSKVALSKIAGKYKISPQLLYAWRSKKKRADSSKLMVKSGKTSSKEASFVEIKLEEPNTSDALEKAPPLLPKSSLAKASLIFEDFSLVIEGKFSSRKLMQLIATSEQQC